MKTRTDIIYFFILSIFLAIFVKSAWCNTTTLKIRLAILDNFQTERLASDNYALNYMEGVKTAISISKVKGFDIEYKTFFYDKSPLGIFKMIPAVDDWKPDVIIGPRSSDKLLLLKHHFSGIVVLSSLATASQVSALPENFYSLTFPTPYAAQAIFNFVRNTFPNKKVFSIVQVDCKSCVDVNRLFSQIYTKTYPSMPLTQVKFISDSVEKLEISAILKGYKKGDVIFLPDDSYSSGVLMSRIVNYLKQSDTIFVGGDYWGAWKDGNVGKFTTAYHYQAFRVCPWSIDLPLKEIDEFKRYYNSSHQSESVNVTSYIAFRTVMSIIAALQESGYANKNEDMRNKILSAFKYVLGQNPNWFRPKSYAVYKLNSNNEQLVDTVFSFEGNKNESHK